MLPPLQNDLQAMARCHRIGQDKEVKVYRLITSGTYEQNVFECSTRKQGEFISPPLCSPIYGTCPFSNQAPSAPDRLKHNWQFGWKESVVA